MHREKAALRINSLMKHTYLIAEIGQNHNGSTDVAKLIIDLITRPPEEKRFGYTLKKIDAVKLTKRDLEQELSDSQRNAPYETEHSFGATYGEHRAALELSDAEHFDIYQYAKSYDLDFIETLCAPGCLSLLDLFTPDYLKVASRDLTNLPLLDAMAETRIPIIVSTGMAGQAELDEALEVITKHHEQISILHCVSQYPTDPVNVNLRTIDYLKEQYPQYRVGYSDHTIGISVPVAASAMGAEIIEKHVTIDRRMKGSDHAGSLGPDGVMRMTRDIRLLDMSLGEKKITVAPGVEAARKKLQRSIATRHAIQPGQVIGAEDIHLLSPGDGYQWSDREQVIGRTVVQPIAANEIIYDRMLES